MLFTLRLTSLLLLLAACGSDPADEHGANGNDPTVDAGMQSSAPPCATIVNGPAPTPSADARDGMYVASQPDPDKIVARCASDDGGASHSNYLRFERGHMRSYIRHYASGAACINAAFDRDGDQELTGDGELRRCGPAYVGADGIHFQQAVWLRTVFEDGSIDPVYLFIGDGPATMTWNEVVLGGSLSNVPFAHVPDDLAFQRYRRPK